MTNLTDSCATPLKIGTVPLRRLEGDYQKPKTSDNGPLSIKDIYNSLKITTMKILYSFPKIT